MSTLGLPQPGHHASPTLQPLHHADFGGSESLIRLKKDI
jgi:hypothetical protein